MSFAGKGGKGYKKLSSARNPQSGGEAADTSSQNTGSTTSTIETDIMSTSPGPSQNTGDMDTIPLTPVDETSDTKETKQPSTTSPPPETNPETTGAGGDQEEPSIPVPAPRRPGSVRFGNLLKKSRVAATESHLAEIEKSRKLSVKAPTEPPVPEPPIKSTPQPAPAPRPLPAVTESPFQSQAEPESSTRTPPSSDTPDITVAAPPSDTLATSAATTGGSPTPIVPVTQTSGQPATGQSAVSPAVPAISASPAAKTGGGGSKGSGPGFKSLSSKVTKGDAAKGATDSMAVTPGLAGDPAEQEEDPNNPETSTKNRFFNHCKKGEWAMVEQIMRWFSKDNPPPFVSDEETGETPLMMACRDNKLVIVERFLDFGMNINEQAKDGKTALHHAAMFAKEEIVKLMLAKKADPGILGGNKCQLPLHMACSRAMASQQITSMLVKNTKNGRLTADKDGAIPLMCAVEGANPMTIKELLDKEAEPQLRAQRKDTGDTSLHMACRRKDLDSVRLLCEAGASPNAQNFEGQTPLHVSAQEGDENTVKYFHTNKANANILDNMDRSPLHMAAERGHTRVVEYLIDKFKCNVLNRDMEGSTLMHVTSLCGYPETTLAFLRRGVPLHMPNKAGAVCLHAAAQRGHASVVKALLDKGANVNARTKDLYSALHVAVKHVNPQVVETLLGYGAEVNVKGGQDNETPLHIAALVKGGEKCAEMLMKSGANVNDTMQKGETALHIASRMGNLNMIQALLAEGADPTQQCTQGNSSLHIAVRHCHYHVAKELLTHVSKVKSRIDAVILVNSGNNEGETPLHYAAELIKERTHSTFEDTDVIKLLLEYDGDMSIQTKFTMETPLHYCSTAGNADVLLEIVNHLQHKIQMAVNKQAKNGWSPLLFASEKGHKEIVRILLKNNARVDVFDEHGMAALHLSAENGHCQVADVLLLHKAFVNAKSKAGLTPLHLAAQNGYRELVELLIKKHNASIDALTMNKRTPLHLAAQHGKKDVCEALLTDKNNPADPTATDSRGQTPLHLAAEKDHSDVMKLFLKYKPELVTRANTQGMTCAHIAAHKGSQSVIKELMRFNKAIICTAKNKTNGSTALHLAAEGGHVKLVKTLLDSGASPAEENFDGMTPLHLAAKHGHIEILYALKGRVSLRLTSHKTGMTPLHVAAHYGQIDFVREMLSDVPANIKSERPKTGDQLKDLLTESGLTPLHLAAQSGHENLVRLLLNCNGVQVDSATNQNGTIPLHFAAQNGHTNVASLLLSKSAHQLHIKDSKGRSALHLASAHGHIEMVALLTGQGSDINACDNSLFTPLHFAAKSGFLDVCKLLVESGASTCNETSDDKIALIFAAHFNHTDVVSFLFRHEHDSLALMEDFKFLYDIMLCSKINNYKTVEEFILLSPAPSETAAKLSQNFVLVAEKEKERARDLFLIAKYCESMCADLVALAVSEKGADKLLKAVDIRGIQFLDILIETEQKEVIAHPSLQRYLSDVWKGNLNWPTWKFMFFFLLFFSIPPLWMIASLPIRHRYQKSPVLKFAAYLISHIYMIVLFIIVGVQPIQSLADRSSIMPTPSEWILLLWISGQLVSELTNPADRGGLGLLKVITIIFAVLGVTIQVIAIALPHDSQIEALFIRNQLFGLSTFLSCVVILDFLSFHHLFGPWSIIIRDLMVDLMRFLVILMIFLFGFACMMAAAFTPIRTPAKDAKVMSVGDIMILLYFSLYGLVTPDDLPKPEFTPSYSILLIKLVFGIYMCISLIVLINLLIAMMSDTYQRIQAESDTEWKFGRAKLIRNMNLTSPTPAPLILISTLVFYIKVIHHRRKNLPLPRMEEMDWGKGPSSGKSSGGLDSNAASGFRRKSQVSPGMMGAASGLHIGPEKIEEVVEWGNVVRKYLSMRAADGGMVCMDDYAAEENEDDRGDLNFSGKKNLMDDRAGAGGAT